MRRRNGKKWGGDGLEENSIEPMGQSRNRTVFCQRCHICRNRKRLGKLGTPKETRLVAQEKPGE